MANHGPCLRLFPSSGHRTAEEASRGSDAYRAKCWIWKRICRRSREIQVRRDRQIREIRVPPERALQRQKIYRIVAIQRPLGSGSGASYPDRPVGSASDSPPGHIATGALIELSPPARSEREPARVSIRRTRSGRDEAAAAAAIRAAASLHGSNLPARGRIPPIHA